VYDFDADIANRFGSHVLSAYYPSLSKPVFPNVLDGIPIKSLCRALRAMQFPSDLPIAIKVRWEMMYIVTGLCCKYYLVLF
jgi:hypothetical protein